MSEMYIGIIGSGKKDTKVLLSIIEEKIKDGKINIYSQSEDNTNTLCSIEKSIEIINKLNVFNNLESILEYLDTHKTLNIYIKNDYAKQIDYNDLFKQMEETSYIYREELDDKEVNRKKSMQKHTYWYERPSKRRR